MKQLAEERKFSFVFTGLSKDLQHRFENGAEKENALTFRLFEDLDHGVEWCEDQILQKLDACDDCVRHSIAEELAEQFQDEKSGELFVRHLKRNELNTGGYLMRQGDPPQAMHFIESGQVTAQLEMGEGKSVRLRTMGAGTVVGEIGMFMGTKATASVVVTQPSVTYSLTLAALKAMEDEEPEIAAIFHKYIIRLLGERLSYTNRSLKVLLE